METDSIIHHINSLASDKLIESIYTHHFELVPYKHLLDFNNNFKDKKYLDPETGILLDHDQLINHCKDCQLAMQLIEGIELLELFHKKNNPKIEDFLKNDEQIYNKIKDQLKHMFHDKKKLIVVPNFSNYLKHILINKKNLMIIISIFLNEAVALVKENCDTFDYMEHFIDHGITNEELRILDEKYSK